VIRAGVVLRSAAGVAAIERVRDGMTYHVLPGGQVDPGETPAEAARREAHEELGLIVSVGGLVAMVHDRPGSVAQPGATRRTGSAAEGDRCGPAGCG
jgi:8-oxo-dGTP pyrophosphatase MutT (NUDIX family)